MIRAAIFDMDGTLLDSQWIWTGLGARYLRAQGLTPQDDLDAVLSPLSMEDGCRYLVSAYRLSAGPEEVAAALNGMVAALYRDTLLLKPHADALVRYLGGQNVRMCVVTATDRRLAEAALRRCGIWERFAFLLSVSDFGTGKEQPDIYYAAARRLGAAPEETLIFEDAPHALRTAHDAGFPVIGIWDATAGDPEELRPLCRQYWECFPAVPERVLPLA